MRCWRRMYRLALKLPTAPAAIEGGNASAGRARFDGMRANHVPAVTARRDDRGAVVQPLAMDGPMPEVSASFQAICRTGGPWTSCDGCDP